MRGLDAWIDELERDLGQTAKLQLIANCGGQRREIPKRPAGSRLSEEVALHIVEWLSMRFGGTTVDVPSSRGSQQQDLASKLRATVLEAGLTGASRSANDIATEFGVTAAWVHKLRSQLRKEYGNPDEPYLPLFDPLSKPA